MMKNYGIALLEMVVIISILSILLVITGFSFVGWQGKYSVESTTKVLYTDLMNARTRAMTRNRTHFVDFPDTTSYTIYDDDSDSTDKVPDGDGILQTGTGITADTKLPTFPKTVEYDLNVNLGGGATVFTITFNKRGIVSPNGTICIFTDFDPDYDCIVISPTRINMGELNTAGGACNAVNCLAK